LPSTPGNNSAQTGKKHDPSGFALIARFQKALPNSPGVYRMIGANGKALYVGKALNLKKRVASYTRKQGHSNRIIQMIMATRDMEFVTCGSESEALLLEANMIKRLKPHYNVLLRDDKAFPYILLTGDHEAAQIVKHRGAKKRKGKYFGPFASAGAVNRAINTLQRGFLLRNCPDSVYENRTRPCLLYQIRRCSAPCTGEISLAEYGQLTEEAERFLRGKSDAVQKLLVLKMEQASCEMEYETAAAYRDRIAALNQIRSHQGINPQGLEEADVFAIHTEAGQFCVQVFFFRTGQNWGNKAYFPRAAREVSKGAVLGAFLAQFYDNKPPPGLILLSDEICDQELLARALSISAGCKVDLHTPKRGEKYRLISHGIANAREALARRIAGEADQKQLLEKLGEALGMDEVPQRIEVYDNSHIQGTNQVGAMIVADDEGFCKSQYRKFNIKSAEIAPGDDYGMMREVIIRRFSRMLKTKEKTVEAKEGETAWPDLLLIDGGAGQLASAENALAELEITGIKVAGIAKGPDRNAGRERFFTSGRPPFMLAANDPVLYFVQRLRDEAHRFAIGTHRTRRKKSMYANPLDDIPGVGAARKRALLRHFGSAKSVARASIEDILDVEGINKKLAETIHNFFRDD
jgi:excinuclease ABC subunit C